MKDDIKEITITFKVKERWLNHFMSFIDYLRWCSQVGHSGLVGFYADGDGDFRFNYEANTSQIVKMNPITQKDVKEKIIHDDSIKEFNVLELNNKVNRIMACERYYDAG